MKRALGLANPPGGGHVATMKKRAVHGHVVCAGMATPETELLALLVKSVLEHVGRGPVAAYHANNAHDQLIESLARAPSISVLLCERPELDFADACVRTAVPVVLAVPDLPVWIDPVIQPAETGGHGADPYSAVHAMFEVAAPLLDLAVAADPLMVTTSEILDDFTGTIRRLAEYLECDLRNGAGAPSDSSVPDPAVRSRIKDLHAALHQRRHARPVLAPPVQAIADAYQSCFTERDTLRLSFGTELLPKGHTVMERRPGVLDLTGREGPITVGPHVCLPRGLWTGRYTFAIAPNAVGVPLHFCLTSIFAGVGAELARTQYVPRVAGEHAIVLTFEVTEPLASIEFAVFKSRAMFEGDFAIGAVEFLSARARTSQEGELYQHLAEDAVALPATEADALASETDEVEPEVVHAAPQAAASEATAP